MLVERTFTDLSTPTGVMRTHVFAPRGSRRDPGLILYSEIFQVTEPIARLSFQFASHGFVVMTPEIYHQHEPPGTILGYDAAGKDRGNALKHQTRLKTFDDDAAAVVEALERHPLCNGGIGSVGFCIGGHLAFRAALHPRVAAAACFYPTDLQAGTLGEEKKADSLARAGDIGGELLMIFGRQDPHVPPEGREVIYRALHQSGVLFTWHELNTQHAFMRDGDERHDAAAARQAFGLALDLFERTLR
ncbi:MAG TPA: dienelactone hydrolase family protein [Thermoanaerobaculia bacterium]|nr:dienelactone hydrolase family protein [Thermoanaerobaculia bacterium]